MRYVLFFEGDKMGEYETEIEALEHKKKLLLPYLMEGLPEPSNAIIKIRNDK